MNETNLGFPMIIETDDFARCLDSMGAKPLKLIAEHVMPEFGESGWSLPEWSFKEKDGKIIDRKLLANPQDTFQFSIANENSSQDFHVHENVFEVFVSEYPISIEFERGGKFERLEISRGVLIVPPGVAHIIKLGGLTFVFQATINGGRVGVDKTIGKKNAPVD